MTGQIWDLLDWFTSLVGPEASRVCIHDAARQEGLRIAHRLRSNQLEQALQQIDVLVDQYTTTIEDRGGLVRIEVIGSRLLAYANPVQHAVVLGLIEGSLEVMRRRRFKGTITRPSRDIVQIEFQEA